MEKLESLIIENKWCEVKKEFPHLKLWERILIRGNWTDDLSIWKKMAPSININKPIIYFKNYIIYLKDISDSYDHIFYINPTESIKNLQEKGIIPLYMEPQYYDNNNSLYILEEKWRRSIVEWHLSLSLNSLLTPFRNLQKIDRISVILSPKYFDPGHKKRVDFVKYLKDNNFPIDIWGENNLSTHGSLPPYEKDKGIIPYKYHLAVENHNLSGYNTEKLWDGILSECIVFYWGSSSYKNKTRGRGVIEICLQNFENDMKLMYNCLENKLWEKEIFHIRDDKRELLENHHLCNEIRNILNSK